jgi:hypothetical protein
MPPRAASTACPGCGHREDQEGSRRGSLRRGEGARQGSHPEGRGHQACLGTEGSLAEGHQLRAAGLPEHREEEKAGRPVAGKADLREACRWGREEGRGRGALHGLRGAGSCPGEGRAARRQACRGKVAGLLYQCKHDYEQLDEGVASLPPGKGKGGKPWPGWFWGSMGFACAWPSAA